MSVTIEAKPLSPRARKCIMPPTERWLDDSSEPDPGREMHLLRLATLVRSKAWLYSKIPAFLTVAFGACLGLSTPSQAVVPIILLALVSIMSAAAFGYVINDAFDVDED